LGTPDLAGTVKRWLLPCVEQNEPSLITRQSIGSTTYISGRVSRFVHHNGQHSKLPSQPISIWLFQPFVNGFWWIMK